MRTVDVHSDCENLNTLMYKLNIEFKFARREPDKLLCLIVGYGSNGGSHKIRNNVITLLDEYKDSNRIKDYILGSDIDIFNFKYQSFLGKDKIPVEFKNRVNPGVILVYL